MFPNRKNHAFVLLVVVGVTSQFVLVDRALFGQSPNRSGVTETKTSSKPSVLVLEGTPYECGFHHGNSLKNQIHELVRLWKTDLRKLYKTDPDRFVQLFMEETDFRSAMEKWTPGLLQEIKGIADGADIDFNTMFVFQFGDETWVRGDLVREHCSSLGFSSSGEQPTYVAQNLDLDIFRDGYQVVLHVKYANSDVETLVVTNVGCIGWSGMNNKRIGIVANTVSGLNNARSGLPCAAVIRGVLMQQSEEEAVAFVQGIKHATGLNYVIGGPKNAYSFEASANKVVRYRPDNQDKVVWHTNHPLVNDDYTAEYKTTLNELKKKSPVEMEANTRARLANLRKRIEETPTAPRFASIKEILGSQDSNVHPICGTKGEGQCYTKYGFFSFSGMVMVLSEKPQLHCTFGPPNRNKFEMFTFERKAK